MNTRFYAAIVWGIVLAGGASSASGQVSRAEDREAVLARAERFVARPVEIGASRADNTPDPFYAAEVIAQQIAAAEAELEAEQVVNAPPSVPDREILKQLAEQIRPSGVLKFGSDSHLLFGERRIKSGDFLTIKYQGENYSLQVMKVETHAFMLRLNEEVISKRIQ